MTSFLSISREWKEENWLKNHKETNESYIKRLMIEIKKKMKKPDCWFDRADLSGIERRVYSQSMEYGTEIEKDLQHPLSSHI